MNRTSALILTILLSFFFICYSFYPSSASDITCIYVFYSHDCHECHEIIKEFLPPIFEGKEEFIEVRYFEINNPQNYSVQFELEEKIGKTGDEFPFIFIAGHYMDYPEILEEFEDIFLQAFQKHSPCEYEDIVSKGEFSHAPVWEVQPDTIPLTTDDHEPLHLAYFYEPGCKKCTRVEKSLEFFKKAFPGMNVREFNVMDREDMIINAALCIKTGVPEDKFFNTPSLFIGNDYLIKEELTDSKLKNLLVKYELEGSPKIWELTPEELEYARNRTLEGFGKFSFFTILLAGLVDGINPCAFITILFFVAYLGVAGRKGFQIILVGISFTLGIFSAYFALGFGLYSLIDKIKALPVISMIVYIGTCIFLYVLAVLTIIDFFRFKKGKMEEGILNLPKPLRDLINKVIRKNVKIRYYVIASFFIAIIVSIIELACTGQVYIPTIIYATKVSSSRFRAILYLLVYNNTHHSIHECISDFHLVHKRKNISSNKYLKETHLRLLHIDHLRRYKQPEKVALFQIHKL